MPLPCRAVSLPSAVILALLLAASLAAQDPGPPPQRPSGVATGGVYAPVRDEQSRPITAGGFVEGAPAIFVDATEKSGLLQFTHRSGSKEKKYILEVPGSGLAILDYDNDGWPDIYLLNGSTFEALRGREEPPRAALFRNNGDGTFTDVTDQAGVANQRWGFGVAVGDFNNNGWPDLYIANFGKNRLYRNNGDGTFTDVAEQAGVAVDGWSAAPTWGDYDGDGLLDIFVAGYLKFDLENPPDPGSAVVDFNFCQYRGHPVMCGPRGLAGERDYLFRNNGDGTFTDVSEKAGVAGKEGYYGFAAVFADIDDDGRLDLIVANDSVPNYLYRNRGDGTFEDISYPSGFALNENGREQACMGIAIGDYNRNGRLDLVVTNFSDDYNTLYVNDGDGNFTDLTFQAGLGETVIPFLGWGLAFFDYDNDGLLDLAVANGHVYPEADKADWGSTWKQRPLLFRNLDGKRFAAAPAATGSGLALVLPARGLVYADLLNRGRLDLVLNNLDQAPTLLRNVADNANHWVTLKLVGGAGSPRDAIGAKVYLTAGGARQRRDVLSGSSYGSSNDLRLHFGLGSATTVEKAEIHWPSGQRETVQLPAVDRFYTIEEGKGIRAVMQPGGQANDPAAELNAGNKKEMPEPETKR